MTPNNMENCSSVSICDIHRIDTKLRENNDVLTMKIMPKYGVNPLKMTMQKRSCCNQSQSCRNFSFNDKQKSQLDSLFDENVFDSHHLDKSVFPKEKFHGNAKLLLTMNDEILRKAIIDSHGDDAYIKHHHSYRSFASTYHSTNDKTRNKNQSSLIFDVDQRKLQTITSPVTDSAMIDGYGKSQKADNVRKDPLLKIAKDDEHQLQSALITTRRKQRVENRLGYETPGKLKENVRKSSSAPTVYPLKKLSLCLEGSEKSKASERIQKSVSMLSVNGK